MSEALPFLVMVTITWLSLRWRTSSYPCRAPDFQSLFVEHLDKNCNSASSFQSNNECTAEETSASFAHDGCCPICLEKYQGNRKEKHQRIIRTKHCGHVFHEECIMQWCDHQAMASTTNAPNHLCLSCPCCRSNLIVHNFQEDETMEAALSNHNVANTLSRSWMRMLFGWWNSDDNHHHHYQWQRSSSVAATTRRRRYYEQMTGAALGMGILAEAMVLVVRLRHEEKQCPA